MKYKVGDWVRVKKSTNCYAGEIGRITIVNTGYYIVRLNKTNREPFFTEKELTKVRGYKK